MRKLLPSTWSSSGRFLFVSVEAASPTIRAGASQFRLALEKIRRLFRREASSQLAEPSMVPGSQSMNRGELVPGEDPSHDAYVNTTAHRNLYRVSLP